MFAQLDGLGSERVGHKPMQARVQRRRHKSNVLTLQLACFDASM